MTVKEVIDHVKQYPTQWITWTGGEPMLQLTSDAVNSLRQAGYLQSLETNGGHAVPFDIDWLVVSPKVAEHVLARNFPNGVDELRYAWHSGKMDVPRPLIKSTHKFISPICDGNSINPKNLNHCIELCKSNPEWKLSIQQHKIWNIL
jgi:organic radical activating enzyme